MRRRADGFARAAASTAVFVALSCSLGAQAASPSLSNVKFNARTSADEFDYRRLTEGTDRTKKSSHYWYIHTLAWFYNSAWPPASTPTKSQTWQTNALYGGLWDHANSGFDDNERSSGPYFSGHHEWGYSAFAFPNHKRICSGVAAGYDGYYTAPSDKRDAYGQLRTWWRGKQNSNSTCCGRTPPECSSGLQVKKYKDLKHRMSMNGHSFFHHYNFSFWKGQTDLITSEVGENIIAANPHIGFSRGAGRQYEKPWGMDFSDWRSGYISDYGGWWQTAAIDATNCWEVHTAGAYVGWLTSDGEAYYKEPGDDDKVLLASNVLDFRLSGGASEIYFFSRTSDGVKYKKKSDNSWNDVQGTANVAKILDAWSDQAVMLKNDGSLLLVDGQASYSYTGTYSKAWVNEHVVVALKEDGTLGYESLAGTIAGQLTTIDTLVAHAAVDDKEVVYLKGDYPYYKADMTTTTVATQVRTSVTAEHNSGVKSLALGGTTPSRIGVLYNNGALRVATSVAGIAASSSLMAENVDRFQLGGDRIAAIQRGDDGYEQLLVKDGALSAAWVPMLSVVTTAFGLSEGNSKEALFVHTAKDSKILVKNNGLKISEYPLIVDTDNDYVDDNGVIHHQVNYRVWRAYQTSNLPPATTNKTASQIWGGHSLSLMRRVFYASYMAGANIVLAEGCFVFCTLGRRNDVERRTDRVADVDRGPLTLSAEGVLQKQFYDFTKTTLPHAERGIPWIPIAVMLDHYHGLAIDSWGTSPKIWKYLTPGDSELMSIRLIQSIWPDLAPTNTNPAGESLHMVNGPYGEIFDFLTDDILTDLSRDNDGEPPDLDLIANYPVLLLSGEIRPDATARQRLISYVNSGGNLVMFGGMNVAQFPTTFTGVTLGTASNYGIVGLEWKIDDSTKTFSSTQTVPYNAMTLSNGATSLIDSTNTSPVMIASIRTHGSGRVIVVGLPNLQNKNIWGFLLDKLSGSPMVNPFEVTGDIMYQVNYKGADTWLVTLTNNKGISKTLWDREVLAESSESVTLKLQESGRDILSVTQVPIFDGIWRSSSDSISFSNDQFTVSVESGKTRIFKVRTESDS